MRHFDSEFRPQDRWIATFRDEERARTALSHLMGKSVATTPITANLVPLSRLTNFQVLNKDVQTPANCLLYMGFPPGVDHEGIGALFTGLQMHRVILNETCKSAVVEFLSRTEAHRAYRRLYGANQDGPSGFFVTSLQLLM